MKNGENLRTAGIRAVIGLGNPGKIYDKTYHNAGFVVLDYLRENLAPGKEWKKNSRGGYLYIKNPQIIFIKPDVFMNVSGRAIKSACRSLGLRPEEILILHDDSDILLGDSHLVFERGSAGHHGVESIAEHLGTKKLWRLRIGIRKGVGKAGSFVLKKMTSADLETIYGLAKELAETLITKENP